MNSHTFGGSWTTEKLDILHNYLQAYVTALQNQPFNLIYIDAFAGTRYRELQEGEHDLKSLFPDHLSEETSRFQEGSTRLALQIERPFDKYYFIDKDYKKCSDLEGLKGEFPHLSKKMEILHGDSNMCLHKLCYNIDWRSNRAVLFLDPYGMQVGWDIIETIAQTRAIDLWYLFPLGVGVNRLLKKDGKISEGFQKRLDFIFGTPEWRERFYKEEVQSSLFGDELVLKKVSDFRSISSFVIKRLENIFPGVASHPRLLYNSKNNPLYMLCFAAANEKGAKIAIRIAQHLLKG